MIGRGHLGAGLCQGGGGPPKGLCLEGGVGQGNAAW